MSTFTNSTGEMPTSTAYDIGLDESDMESLGSAASSDESAPKDYWFGRKYFECIIAQDILQHSRLHETVAQVDSRLESLIRQFPYARCLSKLEDNNLGSLLPIFDDTSAHGAYRVMMFCIGAVVRGGNRAQKTALLAVLRQHIFEPDRPDMSRPEADRITEGDATSTFSRDEVVATDKDHASSTDPGRYAMALQKHGDRTGFRPVYKVSEVPRAAPTFRASVLVNGSLCEGLARTKKQARHEAAKEACLMMGIKT